jgi:hypothetical protein
MIFHGVERIALFVGTVQQAPILVQCASTPTDPAWKWWLGALAPWMGPLLSGAVSIYVAWRVFRWQGKKDRDQWVRDQKVAEWKSLVELVAEFEQIMPEGEPGIATVDGVRYRVLPLCDRISHLVSQLLFVAPRSIRPRSSV